MGFIKGMFSESDGTPSSTRVQLFLFMTSVILLIGGVVLGPLFKVPLTLPVIPDTFANFVEWIVTVYVTGGAVGKGINAVRDVKGCANAGTDDGQGAKG